MQGHPEQGFRGALAPLALLRGHVACFSLRAERAKREIAAANSAAAQCERREQRHGGRETTARCLVCGVWMSSRAV